MTKEVIGDIIISPRVLEVITGIATSKVEGVHSLQNKKMADGLSKKSLGRGVYLETAEDGSLTVDLYVDLQYGVTVPTVCLAIQQAVKSAIYDMAEVVVNQVNVHVVGIVPEKTPKPDVKSLFDEDFLND
ncbi:MULTISPECIES: Asp23/Gls24 family envelope stress response protein [unclassified Streptococcus]|uniref:Asp23/Gls24 family envelope stress response protein n=1 Tax=unclassified Streptococcus TaxID=2608887 RepID=UPI0011B72E72|nr:MULTISPECIES: Asp23/Gls24 family envelope stress response protein [unclassified Streptococcus]TWS94359.1 Asp23/Gls24 family envelope stress response protein [Streptococcus sp. sy018]TWT10326.1 Asp23/Gls24 family envelope stress response protein [Streptococcus sp. sy004]TWT14636.1 Asp23/Gls24 family envelope stress response protein [Streptococcus sp. sy010]